jgi:predicted transcriptional regulator
VITLSENICRAVELLDKNSRKTIIEIALNNGYAVKDIAELMNVSPPAVSRYIHDTLSPSTRSICLLVARIDEETRQKILKYIAETLWLTLYDLLEETRDVEIVERIADDVAKLLSSITG